MSLPSVVGNDDYQDEVLLRYVLSGILPGSFGEDAVDMSSMDCFVAVIRHICSGVDRKLMDSVASNESLKFVMADFSAETEEKRRRVQDFRVSTFKSVEQLVGKKNPTFEDIVECEAVRKNFWADPGLLLFQPIVCRDELSERWHSKEDDGLFGATQSLVDWPLQDYATIQEVLAKTKFGVRRLGSEQEVRFTFGRPAVVRVRLGSKVNHETWKRRNFSIGDVQCFSYDVVTRTTTWHAAEGMTTLREAVSHKPKDRLMYCLVAVVKLRNPGEDCDRARLYDVRSQKITPYGDQKYFGAFNDDTWLIGHLEHDHMLYYARADDMSADYVLRCKELGEQYEDLKCSLRDERLTEVIWQARPEREQFQSTASALGDFGEDGALLKDGHAVWRCD